MCATRVLTIVAIGVLSGGSAAPTGAGENPSPFPVLEGPYLGHPVRIRT